MPLKYVPQTVINAIEQRISGFIPSEASVDVEDSLIMYAIVGWSGESEYVVEVTAEGTVIQVYDRKDYVDHVED